MKKQIIQLLTIASITMISTLSFAGDEGCSSKKGGHGNISAEAFKEFDKNHTWLKNHGHGEMDKSASQGDRTNKANVLSTKGLIES